MQLLHVSHLHHRLASVDREHERVFCESRTRARNGVLREGSLRGVPLILTVRVHIPNSDGVGRVRVDNVGPRGESSGLAALALGSARLALPRVEL